MELPRSVLSQELLLNRGFDRIFSARGCVFGVGVEWGVGPWPELHLRTTPRHTNMGTCMHASEIIKTRDPSVKRLRISYPLNMFVSNL